MEENYVFLDANVFAYKERNQLVKLLHRIQSKNLKLIMTKKLISEIHNLLASGEIKGRNQNVVLEFIKYDRRFCWAMTTVVTGYTNANNDQPFHWH